MKNNLKIIKLKFTSPLHISRGKADYYDESEKFLRSDTIKSAIFSTMLLFEENKEEKYLKELFESFIVSSAFPFYEDRLFFLRPNYPINILTNVIKIDNLQALDYAKSIKKVKWIELDIFQKIILGEQIKIAKNQIFKDFLTSSVLPIEKESDSQCNKKSEFEIIKNAPQDRVYIYRMEEIYEQIEKGEKTKHSEPYRVDRIFFNKNAGLFFILEAKDEVYNKIIKALKILQDLGLGTDRNVGNGQFEFEENEIEINLPENYNALINLGLYWPEKNEVSESFTEKTFYSLTQRGGYISNWLDQDNLTLLKRPVYMAEEGSIFPPFTKNYFEKMLYAGRFDDVRPYKQFEHPVYRDGRALFLPIKINENDL